MNLGSLDPISTKAASFTVYDVNKGPGVKRIYINQYDY